MPVRSSIEKELILSLTRDDLEKVLKAFAKKKEASSVKNKFSPRYYFDTPHLELNANNISLRVQYKTGVQDRLGEYEQTVKIPFGRTKKKVLKRKECKDVVEGYAPDIAHVSDKDAKAALKPFQDGALIHVFTATVKRRAIDLNLPEGKIEIAFDVGQLMLTDGATHVDLVEIEIEVKRGSRHLISAIKKEIMALAPSAHIQTLSKAQLGAQLYLRHQTPPPGN